MVLKRFSQSLSTCPIKDNIVFITDSKGLPKNPTDCLLLYNWVFDNFIFANEPFGKVFQRLETCV